MIKRLILIGIALVGVGNGLHYASKSIFLETYFPSLTLTLQGWTLLAMVISVAGGFAIGLGLAWTRGIGAIILGTITAAVVFLIFWWGTVNL